MSGRRHAIEPELSRDDPPVRGTGKVGVGGGGGRALPLWEISKGGSVALTDQGGSQTSVRHAMANKLQGGLNGTFALKLPKIAHCSL